MVSQRNRIIDIVDYIRSQGISVNIGKTKARGNKGVFINNCKGFRIDVAENLSDQEALSVIVHEFMHYFHYRHDSSLKSLSFVFGDEWENYIDELEAVTVELIPKTFASNLFEMKNSINKELKMLSCSIKKSYPDFKLSKPFPKIERMIDFKYKFLMKYDRIKIFNKVYSIDDVDRDNNIDLNVKSYIKLRQKQRYIKRINTKINKLNTYYNNKSELFARFMEQYFLNNNLVREIAPNSVKAVDKLITTRAYSELSCLNDIIFC